MTRILLVEDHNCTREEMKAIIDGQEDLTVVAEAASGEEAIQEAARTVPDLIVMDIGLPGINGVEAMRAILTKTPDTKVVALSNYSGPTVVQAVLNAGGRAYVPKGRAFEELIPAIRGVAAGERYFGRDSGALRQHPTILLGTDGTINREGRGSSESRWRWRATLVSTPQATPIPLTLRPSF